MKNVNNHTKQIMKLKENETYGIDVISKSDSIYHIFVCLEDDILIFEPNEKKYINESAEPCGENEFTSINDKECIKNILTEMYNKMYNDEYNKER